VDGRWIVVGLTIVLPAILMVLTVAYYSTNPISMLVLFSVMLFGCLYLLSYSDVFSANPYES
jgi:predicted branched-subunit amino acid permease